MKKFVSIILTGALVLGVLSGCSQKSGGSASAEFDFENGDNGFTPVFADYPNSEGAKDFYELIHEHKEIPIAGAGKGLFISGNNHSDDLFMGYVKRLEGFTPNKDYRIKVSFKLATDVEGGMVGVGGSPGESVTVKCGVVSKEPKAEAEDKKDSYYRMNIDAGIQSNGGKDMKVLGDMSKTTDERPGEYEFKEFSGQFDITANEKGELFLIIASDSGYEAVTSYYLDDIKVEWEIAK